VNKVSGFAYLKKPRQKRGKRAPQRSVFHFRSCEIRRPSLHEVLGLRNVGGLHKEAVDLRDVVFRVHAWNRLAGGLPSVSLLQGLQHLAGFRCTKQDHLGLRQLEPAPHRIHGVQNHYQLPLVSPRGLITQIPQYREDSQDRGELGDT